MQFDKVIKPYCTFDFSLFDRYLVQNNVRDLLCYYYIYYSFFFIMKLWRNRLHYGSLHWTGGACLLLIRQDMLFLPFIFVFLYHHGSCVKSGISTPSRCGQSVIISSGWMKSDAPHITHPCTAVRDSLQQESQSVVFEPVFVAEYNTSNKTPLHTL